MNKSDLKRDYFMLKGPLAKKGYDWWWHSLTAYNKKTGEPRPFFIEYFVCNPALAEEEPTIGQLPENKAAGKSVIFLGNTDFARKNGVDPDTAGKEEWNLG